MLAMLALATIIVRYMIDIQPSSNALSLAWPEPSYRGFRLTSIAVAATVGAALAVSGVLLQALLRNPLASPFVLGLSSGAGLGVTLGMYLAWQFGFAMVNYGGPFGAAIVGSLVVLMIVYLLGQRRGMLEPLSLLLVGIVVSAVCGAFMMFLQQLVPQGLHAEMARWMFGNIPQGLDSTVLITVAIVTVASIALAASLGGSMDAATLSDDEVRSIGVSLGRLRVVLLILAGILAAGAVAISGPIAFVGLIAPHIARLIVGPHHRVLVIASALAGVVILISADIASQAMSVFSAGILPVGIFTALLGGPMFIWLLRRG